MMFHLLFVPRYLDNVPTDLGRGRLLWPVTKLSGRSFSFHCLSTSPPTLSLSHIHKHPPMPFLSFPCHLHPSHPSCHILSQAQIPIFFFLITHPSTLLLSSAFPLFCADIKQLTACLVAGLQRAGRRVLLSLCIYRYFVSQSLCDDFHYAGFL